MKKKITWDAQFKIQNKIFEDQYCKVQKDGTHFNNHFWRVDQNLKNLWFSMANIYKNKWE